MDGKLMIQQAPQEARERKTDLSKVSTNRRDDDEQNRRRSAMQSAGREEVQKVETIRRTDKKSDAMILVHVAVAKIQTMSWSKCIMHRALIRIIFTF